MTSKSANCDGREVLCSIPIEKFDEKTTSQALADQQVEKATTPKKGPSAPRRMPSAPSKKRGVRVIRELAKTSRLPEDFYTSSFAHLEECCNELVWLELIRLELVCLEERLKLLLSVSDPSFDHVRLELFLLHEHYSQLYQLQKQKM